MYGYYSNDKASMGSMVKKLLESVGCFWGFGGLRFF